MRKAAIEDASAKMLEVFERVSAEAKHEKNAVPPVNKMVYYWTRKPLIVGRAVALACTLEKPEHVEELLGFSDTRTYKSTPNRSRYSELLGVHLSDITVLDPFAGTGNLVFPSSELGLGVTCSDYNPLAHLITRSVLEIPASSEPGLAKKFERVANDIIKDTENEVGKFYKTGNLAFLWAWCIRCPHCNQRVPLLNQMYLSVKKEIGLRIVPTPNKNFTVEIVRGIDSKDGKAFTHKKGKVECISCHNTISYDVMTHDIAKNKDKEMIAIQIQKKHGRDYIVPTEEHRKTYLDAKKYFEIKRNELTKNDLIPQEKILASHRKKHTLWHYGITTWEQYFDQRQMLVLSTLMERISSFCASSDTPALNVYLSFLVAKLVNYYSYGVIWHTSRESPSPTLAMRQPRVVFNLAEINPFEKVSGALRNNVSNIVKAIEFCERLRTPVSCKMQSVTTPADKKYDLVITDPPYGDDVQYGELSEFLYLWVYRAIQDKTLPARVQLDEDFCESWGRFGDKKLAAEFFEKGLRKSFVSINNKLKDDGLLAVFFAHSSTQAWNQLLGALRTGGFRVVSSYALHTESQQNPLARNKTSFMSSIVVTCRKITADSSGFIEDVIPDTEDGIKNTLDAISDDKLLNLPITDLLTMVYGKVLESCTKYRTLKSRSGNKEPDFGILLSNAQSVVMRLLVSRLTTYGINTIGPRMAFYILVKVFQNGAVSADDMLKITKAYNIEASTVTESGVAKRDGSAYRLTHLHKNEMNVPPEEVERENLHQQLCYLARQIDTGKAKTIDDILDKENFARNTLKQIVHLLLRSIHLRRNRGHSLSKDDRDELEILETLADIMGIRADGGLDTFT